MGSVKSYNNGTLMKLTPKSARLGGIIAGVNPDEAVNKAQLDAVQQGTVDVARVELSASGTAAAPVITWDGDTDTGLYRIGANNIGITANGAKVVDIATTGVAVTGLISATTTVTAGTGLVSTTTTAVGTALTVGTDQTFAKEVNHTITVATTTTAATAGANLTLLGATGATSGAGGDIIVTGGTGGATAASVGGAITVTTGVSGAGGGASGALSVKSGIGTTGTGTVALGSGNASAGGSGALTVSTGTGTTSTGAITLSTGNASAGTAGNVLLSPGTTSSTTVSPIVIATSNAVIKPLATASVATGAAITGKQLVDGYIAITGGTGNVQLPDTTAITTAIGASPAGTVLNFTVNAVGMTGTNTVTFVVGANMSVASAPAITGGGTLTLTQDTQVIGVFKLVFITATTTKLFRIA